MVESGGNRIARIDRQGTCMHSKATGQKASEVRGTSFRTLDRSKARDNSI